MTLPKASSILARSSSLPYMINRQFQLPYTVLPRGYINTPVNRWLLPGDLVQQMANNYIEYGAAATYLDPSRLPLRRAEDYNSLFWNGTYQVVHALQRRGVTPLAKLDHTFEVEGRDGSELRHRFHNDSSKLSAVMHFPKQGIRFSSNGLPIFERPKIYGGYLQISPMDGVHRERIAVPSSQNKFAIFLVDGERWAHSGTERLVPRIVQPGQPQVYTYSNQRRKLTDSAAAILRRHPNYRLRPGDITTYYPYKGPMAPGTHHGVNAMFFGEIPNYDEYRIKRA